MSAALYSEQSKFVSDWHTACCHPPIHQALVKTMGCLEPALPSLPVQRDMEAKDRCRLISANLISGVCLSQLHGLHINWDHANKTGLNLLNYRFFFTLLTVFFHLSPSFLVQSDWFVISAASASLSVLLGVGESVWFWFLYCFSCYMELSENIILACFPFWVVAFSLFVGKTDKVRWVGVNKECYFNLPLIDILYNLWPSWLN